MKFKTSFLAAIGIIILVHSTTAFADGICSEPVVTEAGQVQGAEIYGVCSWKGIPYAAPPTGDLRWKAPRPYPGWEGVRDATEFGSHCPNFPGAGGAAFGERAEPSEDCLFLNVWSPAKTGRFPVMVWIHGGGMISGSGSQALYDGAEFAGAQDIVLVTINYRLGALGFLALPELAEEDPEGGFGNYGLLDQIAALKWVRENIAVFGGDPGNVTIFGESAGGVSVCLFLASPLARGLFDRAIMMSGFCDVAATGEDGFQRGASLAEAQGCSGEGRLACLRAKPSGAFIKHLGRFNANPHIDGYFLSASPVARFRQGDFNQVPFMAGYCENEWDFYLFIRGQRLLPDWTLENRLKETLGRKYDEFASLYPSRPYRRPVDKLGRLIGDYFAGGAVSVVSAASESGPAFLYRFDWDDYRLGGRWGAFHASELALVFGSMDHLKETQLKPLYGPRQIETAAPLSRKMMAYWANFARTGDPNGEGLPVWPNYDTSSQLRLVLDNEIEIESVGPEEMARYRFTEGLTGEERLGVMRVVAKFVQ